MVAANGAMAQAIARYKEDAKGDPEMALQLAIQETDRIRQDAQVTFTDDGRLKNVNYASLWRYATSLSRSDLVPEKLFKGRPDNCFVAAQLAMRLGCDTMLLMQNMAVINGKPALEAKLMIALVNASGVFKGRMRCIAEGSGESRKWTAVAIDAKTDEEYRFTVTWAMVKAEGWHSKAGSKWMTIPDLMGDYRCKAWLIKTICPEVVLGMSTIEEMRDVEPENAAHAETGRMVLEEIIASAPQIGDAEPEKSEATEQASETKTPEPPQEQQTEQPAADTFDTLLMKLPFAKTIIEANELEAAAIKLAKDDGDRADLANAHKQAFDRIKSTRGQRSNKTLLEGGEQ